MTKTRAAWVLVAALVLVNLAIYGWIRLHDRDRDTDRDPDDPSSAHDTYREPDQAPEQASPRAAQRIYSSSDEVDELASLPYAERTFDPESQKRGVVLHDPSRAFQGLNFFTSRDLPAAFLVDMEGQPVHTWRHRGGSWQHATLLPDGHVIVMVKQRKLMKVDLDSEVIWTWQGRVHHDLWVDADGDIYVLTRKSEWHPDLHRRHPILVDYVTVLDAEGRFLREVSVLDLVRDSPYAFLLPSVQHRTWARDDDDGEPLPPEKVELDFLHTNHVEVFDGSRAHRFPQLADGRVLLSMRHLNAVAIADLDARRLEWLWGPSNLTRQHHPTLLDNGHLLIFDNRRRAPSRVVEFDPYRGEIVWTYSAEDFFTASRGSNQRLPNGNTLITESDPGYVFEVTPGGETVWEFANPRVNDQGERTAIWRMLRFDEDELQFLDRLPETVAQPGRK